MKVYVLEAEHFDIPPRVVIVFATREAAISKAVDLLNIMLADTDAEDGGFPPSASIENWEEVNGALEDYHGAAHCYVWINEMEVQS
jgi:hypothetical protein